MRRWLTALCTLVLVLSMGVVAHAAELSLSSPRPPSLAMTEKCAQAEIDVFGTEGEATVTVAGIPAECSGLPIDVWLHDAGATSRITAEAPAGGGEVTLTPSAPLTTRAAALATIDTWPLPTTASIAARPFVTCRTPDDPAAGCEVQIIDSDEWSEGGPHINVWRRHMEITTTSAVPVRWQLELNLSASSLPFHPTRQLLDYQGDVIAVSHRCEPQPRIVTLRGTAHDSNRPYVAAGSNQRVNVTGRAEVLSPHYMNELMRCPA